MKRQLKIGLDFDGVLTDNGAQKALAAKQLYGFDIPANKFKKEILFAENRLTSEQYRALQKEIYDKAGWLERTPPPDNMLYYLDQMLAAGHRPTVVTSRTDAALELARRYLTKQGIVLEFIGMGYGNSKAPALAGFDVFIDDDEDKLAPVVGIVPNLFLFSCRYNQNAVMPDGVARINGWAHFYNRIVEISQQ